MPKMDWGISRSVIDDFDRSKQYAPYTGPEPRNGVYQWKVKVLKTAPATRDKHPQLRIGLELVPRNKEEKRYAGYFLMLFRSITPDGRNDFTWVPFIDALGVTSTDFTNRTITDNDGNVQKIGKWTNRQDALILAQLKDDSDQQGNARKEIGNTTMMSTMMVIRTTRIMMMNTTMMRCRSNAAPFPPACRYRGH
jgi:hypothetical protein